MTGHDTRDKADCSNNHGKEAFGETIPNKHVRSMSYIYDYLCVENSMVIPIKSSPSESIFGDRYEKFSYQAFRW